MPKHITSRQAMLAAALAGTLAPVQAQTCMARSSAQAATVVELYTSEGCNSCPPADRWLSQWKAEASVVALAFHVDYWDQLGWADRFAQPAFTQRQSQQQAVNGTRYSYTPQIVINGIDRKDWSGVSPTAKGMNAPRAAPVQLTLQRDGERFEATVQPVASAMRIAAYWAVTEDTHSSAVKRGENAGVTLRHDDVVRELLPVSAWQAQPGQPTTLRFTPATRSDAAHPRLIKLVVVDAASGRPLQALKLGC
ncbi:MAG: DUF1223 domain-containing protein [Cytophagales bacterium]|nr:DUF1223 domain-containing protein [Rhizobacter sp.]